MSCITYFDLKLQKPDLKGGKISLAYDTDHKEWQVTASFVSPKPLDSADIDQPTKGAMS